jgi:oligosaccharide repeat unit polymerase
MAIARFPHPVDVASIWVVFYTIPLAVVAIFFQDLGSLVFLHPAAGDPDIETQCLHYAAIALISLRLGEWLATRSPPSVAQTVFPLAVRDGGKIVIIIVALLVQMGLGIYFFGSEVFTSGYATESTSSTANSGQALIYMGVTLIGLTIAYAYLVSLATHRRVAVKICLLAFAALLALAAVRGKRLEVISALLSLLVLMFGTRKSFRSLRGRLLVVLMLALLQTTVGLLRLGQALGPGEMAFNLVAEGLFAGHALPGIVEKIDTNQVDYEYGKRAIMGVLAIVPRFVWPDKDELLYEGDKAMEGVTPLGANSILAEVVLQGGATAVVLWFGILGFAFQRIYSGLNNFDSDIANRRLSSSMIAYLATITVFIPHFRDGMLPAIKLTVQCWVFLYALAGLNWRLPLTWGARLRQRPQPAA